MPDEGALSLGGRCRVSETLATTFRTLAETDCPSAFRLLLAGLDHSWPAIHREALIGLLLRRGPGSQREILLRWPELWRCWQRVLYAHRDRMSRAVRDAVVGADPQLCVLGCEAAVCLDHYDILPNLISVLQTPASPCAETVAATVLRLADRLYEELTLPKERARRRNPQLVREHLLRSLEMGVQQYSRHQRPEVIEAFLVLAGRDNVTLKLILQNPNHSEFSIILELLSRSSRPGIIRLLLSFLDDPQPPLTALNLLASRCDVHFVRHLLRKIGREQPPVMRQNLRRLSAIAWLNAPQAMLEQLDDDGQHALVRLAMLIHLPREQAFAILQCVLQHGRPGGRCAAAEALADFSGEEANRMAIDAIEDPDPAVQAAMLVQLRGRRISGALPRLVEMVDSPHEIVREAVRKSLVEFTFPRYLAAFDLLDDDVRRSTGLLVRKVDPQTVPLVQAELRSLVRQRRLRGLLIARTIDAVEELEVTVIAMLRDEDHVIRSEAAMTLASCPTNTTRQALEEALNDRSQTVQEAARRSLETLDKIPPHVNPRSWWSPAMLMPAPVLAQLRSADSIFNNMGSSLRERNALESLAMVKVLLVAVGAVLALGLVIYLLARLRLRWHRRPLWLFLRLCRVHHVPLRDRWLLWRAARRLRLADPALVFVDPICLEDASALPGLFARGERLLELQAYLFAGADELPEDMLPAAPVVAVPPSATPIADLPVAESVPESSPASAPAPPILAALPEMPKPDTTSVAADAALFGLVGRATSSPPLEWPTIAGNDPSVSVS